MIDQVNLLWIPLCTSPLVKFDKRIYSRDTALDAPPYWSSCLSTRKKAQTQPSYFLGSFSVFTLEFLISKLDTLWLSSPPKLHFTEPPHWTPLRNPVLTVVPPRWDRESAPTPRSPRRPSNRHRKSLACFHSWGATGHLQASCNTLPSLARSWRLTRSLGLRYVY